MRALVLLGAFALLAPSSAEASCAASAQYAFAFAGQAAATLAYGSTYSYTAINGAGASRGFTMTLAQNGMSSTLVANIQMPAIGTLISGPTTTNNDLVLGGVFSGRTADLNSGTRAVTVTVTFAQPVRDVSITVHDVDFASNQFRDWLQVTGTGAGGTYSPGLLTPWGNGNGAAPRTATASSMIVGPASGLTDAQAQGTGNSNNNSDDGTITVSFAQPVTSITLRYGNAPYVAGENSTGQQAIGIAGISFCPMPQVSIAKSSAPISGFNIPGNDVVYTLTVTNAGASSVDAGTIMLSDLLPAGLSFRNLAFDASTTAPVKLVDGGSGVTLAAGAVSYSSDGATWGYTPTSGYDTNVRGVRATPSGSMAANSSFALQFRTAIK